MPQLDTSTFSAQLFWLVICFLSLYFILSYVLVPKIAQVLENRETLRQQKINQASLYREQAEALFIAYENMLVAARKDADQRYQSLVNATALEIEKKKKDLLDKLQERLRIAEQELYRARMEASSNIPAIAQEIAEDVLQKITSSAGSLVVKKDKK